MAAMHSHNKVKDRVIEELKRDYPQFVFNAGTSHMWSALTNTITYKSTDTGQKSVPSILHELGHALLGHNTFKSDVELIKLERDAWDKAVEIAPIYDVKISKKHVERCIDTYRDWLYARSLCPECKQCGLQTASTLYQCVFCSHRWQVSPSRLCRVVRRNVTT